MQEVRSKAVAPPSGVLWWIACVVFSLVAVLLTNPVAETGLNDDWAYSLSVKEWARGSPLRFHGWETSLSLIQIAWAVLWVKIFGYSFTLVRLTTLASVIGCAATLYSLHRSCGVSPKYSFIGVCVVTLSPVFLPVAASFMSDVPSLFLLLLVIQGFVIASKQTGRALLGWVCCVTIGAWILGFNRQTIWFIPIAVLPCFAYGYSQSKQWRPVLTMLWLTTLVVIVGAVRWQSQQPYSIQDPLIGMLTGALSNPLASSKTFARFVLPFFLLTLPIFAFSSRIWGAMTRLPKGLKWGVGIASLALATAGYFLVRVAPQKYDGYFAPWTRIGNMTSRVGVLRADLIIGERPVVLPPEVLFLLNGGVYWVVLSLLSLFAYLAWLNRRELKSNALRIWQGAPTAIQFLTAFNVLYFVLLLPRVLSETAFDRYHLPYMALASLCIFTAERKPSALVRHHIGDMFGMIGIAVWAFFAVATTHDYFAMMRHQAEVASSLEKEGIPRTEISAGFEYDLATQVSLTGHINDVRITIPPGTFRKPVISEPLLVGGVLLNGNFWKDAAPDVRPKYFVTHNTVLDGRPPVKTIRYRIWLSSEVQRVDAFFVPEAQQENRPD